MMVRRGDGINGKGKRKRNEINKKERRKDFIKEEISWREVRWIYEWRYMERNWKKLKRDWWKNWKKYKWIKKDENWMEKGRKRGFRDNEEIGLWKYERWGWGIIRME